MQSLILKSAPALVLVLIGWMVFGAKPEAQTSPTLPDAQVAERVEHLLNTMATPNGTTLILEADREALIAAMPKHLEQRVHEPRTKRSEDREGLSAR